MAEQETITAELGVHLPPGLDTIMGFYDAEVVGLVHAANAFTVREHFQRLIALAQSHDQKTALAALKELRAARREVLELNGFIGIMKNEQINSDGSKQEIVTHQIARMDSIIGALADRRNNNGPTVPSPRILEAEIVVPARDGKASGACDVSENNATPVDDRDVERHQCVPESSETRSVDEASSERTDSHESVERN